MYCPDRYTRLSLDRDRNKTTFGVVTATSTPRGSRVTEGPSSKFAFRLEFSENRPTVDFGWSWGGVTVELYFTKKSRNYGNNAKIASGQGASRCFGGVGVELGWSGGAVESVED